jgi:hypothetical protein
VSAAGFALVAVATAGLIGPATAGAVFPGRAGVIAFASERTGDGEIWTMNGDGSNQVDITNAPG